MSYQDNCCDDFAFWGAASNAPPAQNLGEHLDSLQFFPYDLTRHENGYGTSTVSKEVIPEQWPRVENQTFPLWLVKLPGTPPETKCGLDAPISSEADGSFAVPLAYAMKHVHIDDPTSDVIRHVRYLLGTRGIDIDGRQAFISARTSGSYPDGYTQFVDPPAPSNSLWVGDHHIVNVAKKELEGFYRVEFIDGHSLFADAHGGDSSYNEMEGAFQGNQQHFDNVFEGGLLTFMYQYACNQISQGRHHFLASSYSPTKATWCVYRVKYEGERYDPNAGEMVPGIEIFHTALPTGGAGSVGHPDTEYAGNYVILLPSCRVSLDSSVEGWATGADECHVICKHKTAKKLVVAQWFSRTFRDELGSVDEREQYGFADGTVEDEEVYQVIFDADDPGNQATQDFPDETWDNLKVYAYNRAWDPASNSVKNLALITVDDDSGESVAEEVASDFEQPEGFDPTYLDNGLEDAGLHWETGGQLETDGWYADNADAIDGSYSAVTQQQDVTSTSNLYLKITFNAVTEGDITLKYVLDNRRWGQIGDVWTTITNIPEPENYLDVWLDGAFLSGSDFKIDGVEMPTSRIDNVTVPPEDTPDEEFYLTPKEITIHVMPGTHTLYFNLHRTYQDNGNLKAKIDTVAFGMPVMVGEDYDGARRYFWNGEKLQANPFWAWAARNETAQDDISTRVKTRPEYITMDKLGNILIGNPHYVVRLKRDEDDPTTFVLDEDFGFSRGNGFPGGGYVRFTAMASPQTAIDPPCWDPDARVPNTDSISDPTWGSLQIMPTGGDIFQVRGANASPLDATTPILPTLRERFKFRWPTFPGTTLSENFSMFTNVLVTKLWNQRLHSWRISNNGTVLNPHYSIIWRPTLDSMAWPEKEWPVPPYRTDFNTGSNSSDFPDSRRIRDPYKIFNSTQPRWSTTNFVTPPIFSDAFSRKPQNAWFHEVNNDPPNDEEDPFYWHPDWDNLTGFGPWPSARWQLGHLWFSPTGIHRLVYLTLGFDSVCAGPFDEGGEEEEADDGSVATWRSVMSDAGAGLLFSSLTDFEAVACDCDCCD